MVGFWEHTTPRIYVKVRARLLSQGVVEPHVRWLFFNPFSGCGTNPKLLILWQPCYPILLLIILIILTYYTCLIFIFEFLYYEHSRRALSLQNLKVETAAADCVKFGKVCHDFKLYPLDNLVCSGRFIFFIQSRP